MGARNFLRNIVGPLVTSPIPFPRVFNSSRDWDGGRFVATARESCFTVSLCTKEQKEHPCEVRYELLIYVLTILAIYMML